MKRRIVGGMLLCLASGIAYAQCSNDSKYLMKPVPITTPWAKDVNAKNVLPEYPRPQMARENWINLNGLWDYAITKPDVYSPTHFDGKILVPYPIESALSGVQMKLDPPASYNQLPVPQNVLWYKKKFNIPSLNAGEKLLLNFGAVSWEATVFINGEQAGHHTGSYTSFVIDISKYLIRGDNEILVKASNPLEKGIGPRGKQTLRPASIWYTPSSGIWQTVWLEKVPAKYIRSLKIIPDVDHSKVHITIAAHDNLDVSIKGAGKTVHGKSNREIIIPINNPRLWSPDDPYLYDVEIKMGADVVKSYFGLRKVEIKKDEKSIDRIFLNNKYTYNLGTLDQGFWPDGLYTAPTDAALKFDIQAIKAMGFNTIRKHIKVEPARWYYHADKLGILVWQDLVQPASKFGHPPTEEAKVEFEKESVEIVEQLNNYPSITTWVLFNEHWGEYDQARMTQWLKSTDPMRLVNGHSGALIVDGKVDEKEMPDVLARSVNSDMTDVHSYPQPAMSPHVPGKAIVLGEFGGIGVQVQGHLFDDIAAGWGYGGTVSAGTLHKQYNTMIDSLVVLEKRGLSASIYTQPFDVETEQNGLMTYDRKVIKIPINVIRQINSHLWPATANYEKATKEFMAKSTDTAKKDYSERLIEYENGKRDSASLRALAIAAASAKNWGKADSIGAEYFGQLKNPLTASNVKFIQFTTCSSANPGFKFIMENLEKIKCFMNASDASRTVQRIIYQEQVKPLLTESPDWSAVDKIVKAYPQVDGEFIIGNTVVYYRNAIRRREKNAVPNLVRIATIYDDRYDGGAYNAWAWEIFENSSDASELTKALEWSKKAFMEDPEDAAPIDTYANLLYKLGHKEDAMLWQQKAIVLNPNEPSLQDKLEKMKANQPTWPVR